MNADLKNCQDDFNAYYAKFEDKVGFEKHLEKCRTILKEKGMKEFVQMVYFEGWTAGRD